MKILIIGAGAYGLALSTILSEKNEVIVYSSLKEEIEKLKQTNQNEKLFPNFKFPKNIKYTYNIEEKVDIAVLALPTNIIENELLKIKNKIKNIPIIITSKGLYEKKFVHQIVKDTLKTDNIHILSGPTFAKDVITKNPISLTLAEKNDIKEIFNEEYVTIIKTDDIIGTEICGVVKNIYAIGSGILEGMNQTDSTKAAYLTKVINETMKIIESLGGKKETIMLPCGIGDTILTCTSKNSRNYTLGYMIGNKKNKEQINEFLKTNTVEGMNSLIEIKRILDINQFTILKTINNIVNEDDINEILKI
jgi:glycerol-3-phosphate dehydrogenase (NAD(P)+)